MLSHLCIAVREHPLIPLVITLRPMIRESMGGTLDLGRDEEIGGVGGDVAGTRAGAGRYTQLGFFPKESSLVFSKLLHHTF